MSQSIKRRGPLLLQSIALTGMVLLLVSCSSSSSDAGSSEVPPGTPESVVSEPVVELGVTRGDTTQQFHDIRTPFVFNDGQVVVPDGGSNTIRVFGQDGEHVRTLGGSGEGPGEFEMLDAAWNRGDTIEAWDTKLGRLTRFYPGDSVAVVTMESGPSAQQAVPGALPDGWVIAGVSSAGMGERDEMAVHHFDRQGNHMGVIARTRGMSRYRTSLAAGPDPLSPRPQFDVQDGRVYVAETLTPEIRVMNSSGDSLRTISWQSGTRPSAESAVRQTIQAIVDQEAPTDSASLRERMTSFPVREQVSAFWSFLVDEQGFVWVQPYSPRRHSLRLGGIRTAGPGGEWIVFSSDGRRLTSVKMPDGLQPTQITSDAVVGISRDEVGVQSVHVFPLQRQ